MYRVIGLKVAFRFAVLIFLFVLVSQAFAVNCGMLELETYDVEVWENSTKTVTFLLHNYAGERFYIDKVNAYDFERGIVTEEHSWQDIALSGEEASIRVSVKAEKGAEDMDRKAKVEVTGHFLGGTRCSYGNVHAGFNVDVLKERVYRIEPRCSDFYIYTLSEKRIDGFGRIEFIAENGSEYSAVITLEAPEMHLSDDVFYVPAGEEKVLSVEVQSAVTVAELEYNVSLSDCGIPSKKTRVYSSTWIEPEPTPYTPEPGTFRKIELDHSLAADANGFLATVSIYNPNGEAVTGTLEVSVPDSWTVIGDGIVTLEPYTEVLAAVRVIPPENFSGEYTGELSFSYDGITESQDMELERGAGQGAGLAGTAFSVLGSGAVLAGLAIVVIILVAVLLADPTTRQHLEPWREKNK